MSRITQLALAGSVLFGGASSVLAQKIDPLLQITSFCNKETQSVQGGIQNRVENCFIQDGNGKVYPIKNGESIQIGIQLFTRNGASITRKYTGEQAATERNIAELISCTATRKVEDCMAEQIKRHNR